MEDLEVEGIAVSIVSEAVVDVVGVVAAMTEEEAPGDVGAESEERGGSYALSDALPDAPPHFQPDAQPHVQPDAQPRTRHRSDHRDGNQEHCRNRHHKQHHHRDQHDAKQQHHRDEQRCNQQHHAHRHHSNRHHHNQQDDQHLHHDQQHHPHVQSDTQHDAKQVAQRHFSTPSTSSPALRKEALSFFPPAPPGHWQTREHDSDHGHGPYDIETRRTILVHGLDRQIGEDALYATFSLFGKFRACNVVRDAAGVTLGYGFVHYDTEEAAIKASAYKRTQGIFMGRRTVKVTALHDNDRDLHPRDQHQHRGQRHNQKHHHDHDQYDQQHHHDQQTHYDHNSATSTTSGDLQPHDRQLHQR